MKTFRGMFLFILRRLTVLSSFVGLLCVLSSAQVAFSATTTYSYDTLRRLTRVEHESGTTIERTYDTLGNRLSTTVSNSAAANNPPYAPSLPSPSDSQTDIPPASTVLGWQGGDPDASGSVRYSLYFGELFPPELLTSGLVETSYNTRPLKAFTTYYWAVAAKDNHNAVSEGPTWSFTTGDTAPEMPAGPQPGDGITIAYSSVYLSWAPSNDPDSGDTVTYDVYFGTSPSPPLVSADTAETVYSVGALDPATAYYWKIVAKDNHGVFLEGDTWTFSTYDHEPQTLTSPVYSANTTLSQAQGPYLVSGTLTIEAGVTLTIEPGTIIKFQSAARLASSGTLIAEGTVDNPIIFTSYKDDSQGGDTNGDGNSSSPLAGDWYGLAFSSGSDASSIAHTIIDYAGNNGAVSIDSSSLSLSDTIIRNTSDHGIYISGSGSPAISNNTIISPPSSGVYSVSSGSPVLFANHISGAGSYGTRITSGTPDISGNIFVAGSDYDIFYSGSSGGLIDNNTINSGLLANSALSAVSGNTINDNSTYPVRVHADNISELLSGNSFTNIDSTSFLEVNGGTISHDALWTKLFPLHILGDITIQGTDGADTLTTLTVEAGTSLCFNRNIQLNVGMSSGSPGALIAQGTPAEPVYFTANQKKPMGGDWDGIYFNTTASTSSLLDFTVVEYGGNQDSITIQQSSPTISNSIIRQSLRYAVYINGGSPLFQGNSFIESGSQMVFVYSGSPSLQGNTFSESGNYDIYFGSAATGSVAHNTLFRGFYAGSGVLSSLTGNTITYDNNYPVRIHPDNIAALLNNNSISNIDGSSFLEVVGGTIAHDGIWPDLMPLIILGNVTIQGTDGVDSITTLTINAGTELRFNQSTSFKIGGSNGDPGALIARGSPGNTILFTSNQDPKGPGDWNGLSFYNTTDDSTSIMEYCLIEYAGNNGAVAAYQASPTISNSIVQHSADYGFYVSGGSPVLTGNSIIDSGGYGAYVVSGSPTITGNSFTGSSNYDIYYGGTEGGTISGNDVSHGIYTESATLSELFGNNITYDNSYPLRVHADDVGELVSTNTFIGLTPESYLEISGGIIRADVTWPTTFRYHVLSDITIQGKDGLDAVSTLTLEAGTELRFAPSAGLVIGGSDPDNPGALIAQGSASDTILFSSIDTPEPGSWQGIIFNDFADDVLTLLDFCNIEYAGGSGALHLIQASPTISNSQLHHSSGHGIYIQNGSPFIGDTLFTNNGSYDIYYSGNVGGTISHNTFNNNIYMPGSGAVSIDSNTFYSNPARIMQAYIDNIGVLTATSTFITQSETDYISVIGDTISRDATWPGSIRYHLSGHITIQGTDGDDNVSTLMLGPGAHLRFSSYGMLNVGGDSGSPPGALIAEGTEEQPIVLTINMNDPSPGEWYGVWFNDTADDATSALEHTVIEYAGRTSNPNYINSAVLLNSASAKVRYCTIKNSGNYGLVAQNSSPEIFGNTFSDNSNYDIRFSGTFSGTIENNTVHNGIFLPYAGVSQVAGNIIYYNDTFPLSIDADNVGSVLNTGVLYDVSPQSYMEVSFGSISHDATWTDALLYHVLGTITVNGTDGTDNVTTLTLDPGVTIKVAAGQGLWFANSGGPAALMARGMAGRPILFTSLSDEPSPGDWQGLWFFSNTSDSSFLENCTIEYGGAGQGGQYESSIFINASSPTIQYSTIRYSSHYGFDISYSSAFISHNNIYGNIDGGIKNTSNSPSYFLVTAENNWWGDASGPHDPSNTDSLYNPGGTGDAVSDYVDYSPWLYQLEQPVDSDGDGLFDSDETNVYGTSTANPDTDGDAISDGDEVLYWGDDWNIDYDNDGLINLLDPDSDNDGATDGEEIAAGSDPLDPLSTPTSIPEALPAAGIPAMLLAFVMMLAIAHYILRRRKYDR